MRSNCLSPNIPLQSSDSSRPTGHRILLLATGSAGAALPPPRGTGSRSAPPPEAGMSFHFHRVLQGRHEHAPSRAWRGCRGRVWVWKPHDPRAVNPDPDAEAISRRKGAATCTTILRVHDFFSDEATISPKRVASKAKEKFHTYHHFRWQFFHRSPCQYNPHVINIG